jgi:AcrR family transcriptional regulator
MGSQSQSQSSVGGRDRVEQVLEQAARLFTDRGYDATSMRDIAAAVEVRPSSLYHHFPGKQQILFGICHGFQHEFNQAVLPELDLRRSPEEAIRAAVRRHILFSHSRRLQVLVTVRERRSLPREEGALVTALRRQYRDAIVAVIERGRGLGVFTVSDPKLAAMAILDMVNGMGYWFKPRREQEVREMADRYAEAAVALLRCWSGEE